MNALPTKEPTPWESGDAVRLREFLHSETGTRLLRHVAAETPELLDGSDVNKTLVASGVVKGFQLALTTIFNLTVEEPAQTPPPPEMYPSLDDDSKWQDKPTKP